MYFKAKVISYWKIFLTYFIGQRILNKGDEITAHNSIFYRRIYRSDKKYIDIKTGRPLSRAFTPRPKDEGRLSVDLSHLTTPDLSCGDIKKFTIYSITGLTVYSLELKAIYDPVYSFENGIEIRNNAHSFIEGFEEEDESKAGILARSSTKIL